MVFCIMYQHSSGRGAEAWMYTGSTLTHVTSMVGKSSAVWMKRHMEQYDTASLYIVVWE